jgi:hypothetical protein
MKCVKELGGLATFGLMTVRLFTERLLDVAVISNVCSSPPAIAAQAFLQFIIDIDDAPREDRDIAPKDDIRWKPNKRVRFAVLRKIAHKSFKGELTLCVRALIHGRQHVTELNRRNELLKRSVVTI